MFDIVLLLLLVNSINTASSLGSENDSYNEVMHCLNEERQALLSFKAHLIDDDDRLSSWSSEEVNKDCCNWSGVQCDNRTGHVIQLQLYYFNLRGNISSSLLGLRELNSLDLSYNDFEHRPIPNFFGSFIKLEYLDLSYSNFDGIIPCQLGNLSNLNYLSLSNSDGRNLSVENLDWLSHLSSLTYLYMYGVNLSTATNWVEIIKSLPSLYDVNFRQCQLSMVVSPSLSFINSSTSIERLDLSSNKFTSSMYSWLFNLSNSLVELTLRDNNLNGLIPDSFGNYMPSLTHLDLYSNLLEGMIPKSFRNLCNLQVLSLTDNSLSGNLSDFFDNLSGCPEATLESLFVGRNNLFGTLPHGIIKFSSLKLLSLYRNKLNESLTKNLWELSKIENLDLSFNSLTGVVTEAHLSSFPNLTSLDLSFNTLHLQIGRHWVPPFQLETIRLASCNLGPRFPWWIQTQQLFQNLDISNNGISEKIPTWFWNLTGSCTYMNLSSNSIGGTLPDLSSAFGMGPQIDLSSNNFEGSIPLFPSSLASLNLSKNKFSGTLSFLCQLSEAALSFLDLTNNFLTEGIPECLGKLHELVVLYLAHNKLSGEIPSSMGTLFNLETLYLYNNSFSGELPLSLSNCTRLIFLDVGVNKLSGNVPAWLGGNMLNLYFLSLRSNKFFGTIPSNLCCLTALQVLDLSMNNLSGTIPPCLNNLKAMVQKGLTVINYDHIPTLEIIMTDVYLSYGDRSMIGWQGRELQFEKSLRWLKCIDLSSNKLTGDIPSEITELFELVALNLSRNALHGKVPQQIGRLKSLTILDLSRNRLFGKLPPSLSQLSFLNYLDVSYNNFSGKIPSGTQLQSFNASNYIGNIGLCGPPLPSNCVGDEPPSTIVDNEEDNNEYKKCLHIGLSVGFATGFCGTCGALLLNRRGRHAFFIFLDDLKDWLYVKMTTSLRS